MNSPCNGIEIPRSKEKPDPLELQKRRLKEACLNFESLLNAYLFKSMRNAVPRAEEPSHARSIYESMFDEALAEACSKRGGFGLGELLYRTLEPLVTTPQIKNEFGTGNHVLDDVRNTDGSDSSEPSTQAMRKS